MDTKKIIGWTLLAVGLLIIFGGLYFSYGIFTGKKSAPEIFKTPKEEPASEPKEKPGTVPLQTPSQEEISKMIGEQLKGVIPLDVLPKILNLICWSIFVGILVLIGGRVSGIGIKLIKEE